EVEFRSWTSDRIIRHASFQGLREDKPAEEVVQEQPKKTKAEAKPGGKPAKASAGTAATSVKLSHPDKLLWHDEKVSKQDLLDHYALVWPRMEQFVVNRPLSLVRAPDG
ncbi:ATP-dependent DNA ligase, partial [Mesorhizobium sp. M00.F.Ca.ET.149.01.1.1]